jgi:Zn-dependent alcohol dehydrogenase
VTSTARVVVAPANSAVLEVQDVVLPDPGPHQVVVRQVAAGVCHSQLHQLRRPRPEPILVGHESSGVVISSGSAVTHVTEGDHVLLTWVPRSVQAGDRQPEPARLRLPDGSVALSQNVFTWADHTIADERYVVKIPPDAPMAESSIVGCAVMTGAGAVMNTAGVRRADSVAVFGVGGVGLCAIAAARIAGADPIIAVDLSDEKLQLARKFGATEALNAGRCDPVQEIQALTRSSTARNYPGEPVSGVDFAFDCIGLSQTMLQVVAAARSGTFGQSTGGTAVLVGAPTTSFELDARDMLVNQKRFVGSLGGSCSPDRDFPQLLDWVRSGWLDLHSLVTDRFKLDDINDAVHALETGAVQGRAILEF